MSKPTRKKAEQPTLPDDERKTTFCDSCCKLIGRLTEAEIVLVTEASGDFREKKTRCAVCWKLREGYERFKKWNYKFRPYPLGWLADDPLQFR